MTVDMLEDIEARAKRNKQKIVNLYIKRENLNRHIEKLQKMLSEKKIEKQNVEKDIKKEQHNSYLLKMEKTNIILLQRGKFDINSLSAEQIADTILENKSILTDNSSDKKQENISLAIDETSTKNTFDNYERDVVNNETIHS